LPNGRLPLGGHEEFPKTNLRVIKKQERLVSQDDYNANRHKYGQEPHNEKNGFNKTFPDPQFSFQVTGTEGSQGRVGGMIGLFRHKYLPILPCCRSMKNEFGQASLQGSLPDDCLQN
jgi:hypothetical protein